MYRWGGGGSCLRLSYYSYSDLCLITGYIFIVLLNSFVQEDEDDEYEEGKSLMEVTVDQTDNEDHDDENDDKILIGKRTHQVSLAYFNFMFN